MKILDTKTLLHTMETRSHEYKELREKLEQVKRKCQTIVNLDDRFTGQGADAIKGFYEAQIDVVEAWLRLVDRQIAFLNGISGSMEDKDLSGNTVVHLPFLEGELVHHIRNNKEMVASQQDELQRIFNRIDDLVPLNVFSTSSFDDHMEKADQDRKNTIDAVNGFDQELKSEYMVSEGDEQYIISLFQQLVEASRQGNTIQPIHFNAEAYKASDVYQLKEKAEQQANDYLSFKEEQERFREQLKLQEELENRPWYEKTWDGIKTFTGELTGYYDYIRASEGVDPVTGEILTAGQRVAAGAMAAAGFIPIVGWGGRIFKGGSAIYKTAKGMTAADQALDVYRTANTFSNLEKAEMGIYGLVSANGFSEYLTGKDMFGNELTDEQRQNSLKQALGLLAVGGIAFAPQFIKNGKMIREETINKAHELATKTKAEAHIFIEGVKGGMRRAFIQNNSNKLVFAGDVPNMPVNVIDTSSLRKVFDEVWAKFSLKNVGKGTGEIDKRIAYEKAMVEAVRNLPPYNRKPIRPREFKDKVINEDGTTTYVFVNRKNNKEYKVTYDKNGYPVFNSKYEITLPENKYLESDNIQFNYLSKKLYDEINTDLLLAKKFTKEEIEKIKEGKVPESLTWHHHQDPGKMQIVDYYEHDSASHTGGRAIWGGGKEGRNGKIRKRILEALS